MYLRVLNSKAVRLTGVPFRQTTISGKFTVTSPNAYSIAGEGRDGWWDSFDINVRALGDLGDSH